MDPDDEWLKWHKKETQRLEEKERRDKARTKSGHSYDRYSHLVETIMPGILHVVLFFLGWALAWDSIKGIKTIWIRWALYALAPIALLLAKFWLEDLYKERFHHEFDWPWVHN